MVSRRPAIPRRGIALLDVILAGVMLGVGLAVVIGLGSRSLARQALGEKQVTASWLADEMLAMVLVEGPMDYAREFPLRGRFEAPFDAFEYELEIVDQGTYQPFIVRARVQWPSGPRFRNVTIQTILAQPLAEPTWAREPPETIDRQGRYDQEAESR